MSTTTLFVDLLIIGIQVAVWLVLLILCVFGYRWIDVDILRGWEAPLGLTLLGVVYPIGIFVDNLADALLGRWRDAIRDKYVTEPSQNVMTLLMTARDDRLAAYYEHLRVRIRISRSSAFNFGMIAVLFPIFTTCWVQSFGGVSKWLVAGVVGGLSATIASLALYTWSAVTHGFYEKQVRGLQVLARVGRKSG